MSDEATPGPRLALSDRIAALRQPKTWQIGSLTYTRQGLITLFAWLLWGDFAWQARERAVGPVAQLLIKHLHASDVFNSVFMNSIPSALGLLIGPFVSTLSDRTRTRMGRRIPFLLAPTPFAALALIGLSCLPALESAVQATGGVDVLGRHLDSQSATLLAFGALWTVFEIAAVTTTSTFYALVNDVVPREMVGRSFGIFRAVSLLAGILFNYYVIGKAESYYREIFLTVGILYGVGVTLMCLRVKEGTYPPPADTVARRDGRNPLGGVAAYFSETFSQAHYRWIYVATMVAMLAPNAVNAFSVFYAKSIGLDMDRYGGYLAMTYVISFCLSFLLGWAADRFHPLRLTILWTGLYGACMLASGLILATKPEFFGPAFLAHGVLSGCLFTAIVPTYQRLFPKADFGKFYSATGLLGGLVNIVFAPAVGVLLDATGHVYRYTFVIGGVVGLAGALLLLVVWRGFLALGGPQGYIAPGSEESASAAAAAAEEAKAFAAAAEDERIVDPVGTAEDPR